MYTLKNLEALFQNEKASKELIKTIQSQAKILYQKATKSAALSLEEQNMLWAGGMLHFFKQNHEKRVFKYFRALHIYQYPPALMALGTCYQNAIGTSNNMQDAFNCFKRALELDPKLAIASHNLGYCYFQGLGTEVNLEAAFIHFKKAHELDPEECCTMAILGRCYLQALGTKQDPEKGINLLRSALARDPSDIESWMHLADYFYLSAISNPEKANQTIIAMHYLQSISAALQTHGFNPGQSGKYTVIIKKAYANLLDTLKKIIDTKNILSEDKLLFLPLLTEVLGLFNKFRISVIHLDKIVEAIKALPLKTENPKPVTPTNIRRSTPFYDQMKKQAILTDEALRELAQDPELDEVIIIDGKDKIRVAKASSKSI
ncbi:MAG: tetratricopeptide repeat protein [Gammaproteobacteria bacterium]